jgi:hypothetical protein
VSYLSRPRQIAAVIALITMAASARAQTTVSPDVGAIAPDFTLPAATRYGVLRDPITLSDFRGKTVVLAFFFQARTKG